MEHWEIDAHWYGPIDINRVREERFTESMCLGTVGVYFWGAERRGSDLRALYLGQSEDPAPRQRGHLSGELGRLFQRIRDQGWQPLFWMAPLSCEEFCGPRASRVVGLVLDIAEKALIYRVKPEWNRSNSGYMDLERPIRLVSAGQRPSVVPRTIQCSRSRRMRFGEPMRAPSSSESQWNKVDTEFVIPVSSWGSWLTGLLSTEVP